MRLRRSWLPAALAVAYAIYAAYAAVVLLTAPGDPLNAFVTDWLYQLLIAGSVAIAAARAILVQQDRLAWSVIAVALACSSFAELYFIAFEPEGYPSVSDFAWIAFYPVTYVGMVLLLRRRAQSVAGALWLDGLTASVAAATTSWWPLGTRANTLRAKCLAPSIIPSSSTSAPTTMRPGNGPASCSALTA